MPFFRRLKILGEAGKQKILQQMFWKFQISNRLPNRYFPKIDAGCPWIKDQWKQFPFAIILLILIAFSFDCVLIILSENIIIDVCQSWDLRGQ